MKSTTAGQFFLAFSVLSRFVIALPAAADPATDTTTVNDLVPFANLASAAYCPSLNDTTQFQCGPACDAVPDTQVTQFITTPVDTTAFVGISPSLQRVIVGHKGTNSKDVNNLLVDADFVKIPYPPAPNTQVHAGFYDTFLFSNQQILSEVQNQMAANPGFGVAVVGHSLGGATALLSAMDLMQNITTLNAQNLKVVTFGEPRVGDQAFADMVDSLGMDLTRVVHRNDPVPRIPPTFVDFQHHSGQIWTNDEASGAGSFVNCNGQEDPTCSDSVGVFSLSLGDHDGPYMGNVIMNKPCNPPSDAPSITLSGAILQILAQSL